MADVVGRAISSVVAMVTAVVAGLLWAAVLFDDPLVFRGASWQDALLVTMFSHLTLMSSRTEAKWCE